jgi:hypothetical protein
LDPVRQCRVSETPGIGDAAYRDSGYAVHVVKGKVRYYITMITMETHTPERELPHGLL